MKIKKGIFLILTAVMLLTAVPVNVFAGTTTISYYVWTPETGWTVTTQTISTTPAEKKKITVTAKNTTLKKSNTQIKNNKMTVGKKETIQLTVKYGSEKVSSKVAYASSNKKVATVTKTGKIRTKKNGSATITVKYDGQSKNIKLKVHSHTWKKHYAQKKVYDLVRVCCCEEEKIWKKYNPSTGKLEVVPGYDTYLSNHIELHSKYPDKYYCHCGCGSKTVYYDIDKRYYTIKKVDEYNCSCGAKKTK